MEDHLEPVEVQPPPCLSGLEVVVEVSGREAKGMELPLRSEQEDGRSLLVVDPYVKLVTFQFRRDEIL